MGMAVANKIKFHGILKTII